jgi:hypothetical protein
VSQGKKLRAKMGGRVIDGRMTLAEARSRVDRERARRGKPPLWPAAAAAVKSAGSGGYPRTVPVPDSLEVYLRHSDLAVRGLAEAFLAEKGR